MQHPALHNRNQEHTENPLERATPGQLAELDRLHQMTRNERLRDRLDQLANDIGRLRKRLDPETCTFAYLGDRIASHVETLYGFVEPTASELAACYAPGQDDAIDEAIRIVDARYRSLQQRLGAKQ